jgi:cell volume regulation protein A
MSDVVPFAETVALVAVILMLTVMGNRIAEKSRIPAPAMFLVGAAIASDLMPAWGHISPQVVQRIVTVALIAVLFDGGMHIGWRRFRTSAAAIAWIGVAGTFATAAAVAGLAHLLFGLSWQVSLLIGTALAPTDPAVVFAVLGKREIAGRSATILEGESGANDPVGIALMAAIIAAGGATGWHAVGIGAEEFLRQILVGAVVGVAGGFGLAWFIRRVRLPNQGLYPLRTLAGAAVIYGLGTIVGGSGFLAVFIAGILVGDVAIPFQADVRRFHSSLASLGEIVAFTVLGLTVSLSSLPNGHAWQIGLILAVLLAVLVRPLLVGLLTARIRLARGERIFVLWAGLKGAVPILLGTFVVASGVPDAGRTYDIIFVAVAFSVIVQGGLVPWVARRCDVPMRQTELRPWALDVRFRNQPQNLLSRVVAEGSPADGTSLRAIHHDRLWISMVIRDGQMVTLTGDTVLRAGDHIYLQVENDAQAEDPATVFGIPQPRTGEGGAEA